MTVEINGQTYYRTAEVCQIVGIGKSTLFRWVRQNIVNDAEYRDRKGWRLFTEAELQSITAETSRIQRNHMAKTGKISPVLR
ncbi:MAG: MerR family transcriptional regulator [Dehalococcoidia bacterium]